MKPTGMETAMPLMRPLDPAFPIDRQIPIDASPIVLVNVFTLDRADEPIFLQAWQVDADFMKRQPGFISTQLHRAIGESPTYSELCRLGIDRGLQGCVHGSGVQGEARGLSVFGRRLAASVPEGRGAGHLRRIAGATDAPNRCGLSRRRLFGVMRHSFAGQQVVGRLPARQLRHPPEPGADRGMARRQIVSGLVGGIVQIGHHGDI